MKHMIFICALATLILSACDAWNVQPIPYTSATPFPSSTPIILSPTPVVLLLPITATADAVPPSPTPAGPSATPVTPAPNLTDTQAATQTLTVSSTAAASLTFTPTSAATPYAAVNTEILGCDTAMDITHGMGEVTNLYVTIQNTGQVNLANVCATLNGQDEGRPHPDKTKCVASLPAGYQVGEKLTIDTTLGKPSPVQVDVTSEGNLLQRLGQKACAGFGLFSPNTDDLGTITPIP